MSCENEESPYINEESEDNDSYITEEESEEESKEINVNVLVYYKEDKSKCGYCKGNVPTSYTYGAWSICLNCDAYQDMIDMGWRRSGKYCYKPILEKSCCPQNTIRLRSKEFEISKSHKKVLKKMEKFLLKGSNEMSSNETPNKTFKFPTVNSPETLMKWFGCLNECKNYGGKKFEIKICKSCFEEDTYQLYRKYQMNIHKEPAEKVTENGYKSFLVNTPLNYRSNNSNYMYGSYHQKYYIDGKLIAVGIIDILPKCLSSVYFIYDTDYSNLSLGVFSALQEINFSLCLNKYLPELKYYYLGFYIHSCPKMVYKAQYSPSDLLDPEIYCWVPMKYCLPLLEKSKGYVPFIRKLKEENNSWVEGKDFKCPFNISDKVDKSDLLDMKLFMNGYLMNYNEKIVDKFEKDNLEEVIKLFGKDLAKKIFFNVSQ